MGTGLQAEWFGVRIPAEATFVPSKYPHKLFAIPSLLFSGYRFLSFFARGKAARI
jgi:hypothetical protein